MSAIREVGAGASRGVGKEVGEALAADGAIVLTVDRARTTEQEASALALWIIMAVNTLAGFKAEISK